MNDIPKINTEITNVPLYYDDGSFKVIHSVNYTLTFLDGQQFNIVSDIDEFNIDTMGAEYVKDRLKMMMNELIDKAYEE